MGLVRRARGLRRSGGRGSWCCRAPRDEGDAYLHLDGGLVDVSEIFGAVMPFVSQVHALSTERVS